MPIFFIFYLFHILVLIQVHFSCSNFAAWWLEREVVWRLSCFCSCIDMIVVRVKVSREIVPFLQWGSTVCTQANHPKGRIAGSIHIFLYFLAGLSVLAPPLASVAHLVFLRDVYGFEPR
jgi:hypothetical protein